MPDPALGERSPFSRSGVVFAASGVVFAPANAANTPDVVVNTATSNVRTATSNVETATSNVRTATSNVETATFGVIPPDAVAFAQLLENQNQTRKVGPLERIMSATTGYLLWSLRDRKPRSFQK